MSPPTEDRIGKALMLLVFVGLAVQQGVGLSATLAVPARPPLWLLSTIGQFFSLGFVAFVVLMTLRRLPPRQNAEGIEPRITAIAGTFALVALVWLPPGNASALVQLLALLLLIGTITSIYCPTISAGRSRSWHRHANW
jgi:hypothetical protein